jgi:hypothetical protein
MAIAEENVMMQVISPLVAPVLALVLIGFAAVVINAYGPVDKRIRVLTNVVLSLIVIGMMLWLINTYVPMAESIKAILNIVVVIGTIVLVLQAVGLWDPLVEKLNKFRMSRARRDEEHSHEGPHVRPAG